MIYNSGRGTDGRYEPSVSNETKDLVIARDGPTCYKCGRTPLTRTSEVPPGFRSYWQRQFDHVIPEAKGGSNGPENIRVICQDCNLALTFENGGSRGTLKVGDSDANRWFECRNDPKRKHLLPQLEKTLNYVPYKGWVKTAILNRDSNYRVG